VEGQIIRLALNNTLYSYSSGVWVPLVGGGGGSGSAYVYVQVAPSAVWTITHPLGYMPAVDTVDTSGEQIVGDVRKPSPTQVIVTFLVPVSGYAYLT
jgi:hypothetical protein